MFEINPLSSIRMVPIVEWDRNNHQTPPFDISLQEEQVRTEYEQPKKYYQKFISRDVATIQILSSYNVISAEIRECCTGKTYPLSVVDMEAEIVGIDASCYHIDVDFSIRPLGKYEVFVSYIDDNEEEHEWVSEPIWVKDSWPETRLFEYTHSRNDFSMVFKLSFDGPVVFRGVRRIECDIVDFKPSSIDTIYADQIHNTTQVRGIPFRQYSLITGVVPDYIIDCLNRILLCNQVKIDSQYYTKSEGAQFEGNRNNGSRYSSQTITISESENRFDLKLDTNGITDELMAIQKTIDLFNNTSDVTINNRFRNNVRHEFISVFNPTKASFTMTVKATSDDPENDMPEKSFEFNGESTRDFTYVWLFDRPKTYYITGINGIPLNIIIGYKKLDASPAGGTSGNVSGRKNTVSMYHGTPAEFQADFDIDTGLGIEGGAYEGCAVCNGDHGTPNLIDRMIIGNDGITDQVANPANASGGDWLTKILKTNLPIFRLKIFGAQSGGFPAWNPVGEDDVASPNGLGGAGGGWDQYKISKSPSTEATVGVTSGVGGSNGDGTGTEEANFSLKGKYYSMIFYKQIE